MHLEFFLVVPKHISEGVQGSHRQGMMRRPKWFSQMRVKIPSFPETMSSWRETHSTRQELIFAFKRTKFSFPMSGENASSTLLISMSMSNQCNPGAQL